MKNNRLLFIIVIVLLLFMCGCEITPQTELDNFITDLDVLSRLEEIAFNIEFGRWSDVFQRDIFVLITDLNTFDSQNEQSISINNQFIKSANLFLEANIAFYNGNKSVGKIKFQRAKVAYETAFIQYHEYVDAIY